MANMTWPSLSSTLSPKIHRKIMLPRMWRKFACMNMLVATSCHHARSVQSTSTGQSAWCEMLASSEGRGQHHMKKQRRFRPMRPIVTNGTFSRGLSSPMGMNTPAVYEAHYASRITDYGRQDGWQAHNLTSPFLFLAACLTFFV